MQAAVTKDVDNYVLSLAPCALLQCLQSTDFIYYLPLHLLPQWGSLAVVAYWLCLPAAVAAKTIRYTAVLSNCKWLLNMQLRSSQQQDAN